MLLGPFLLTSFTSRPSGTPRDGPGADDAQLKLTGNAVLRPKVEAPQCTETHTWMAYHSCPCCTGAQELHENTRPNGSSVPQRRHIMAGVSSCVLSCHSHPVAPGSNGCTRLGVDWRLLVSRGCSLTNLASLFSEEPHTTKRTTHKSGQEKHQESEQTVTALDTTGLSVGFHYCGKPP